MLEAVNKYSQDAMIVLTPNDQLQNTSYRVSEHNLEIICKELNHAHKLLKKLKPSSKIISRQETKESNFDKIDKGLAEQNQEERSDDTVEFDR